MLVRLDDEKENPQATGSHGVELNIPRRLIHSLTKKPHSGGQLSSSVEFLPGGGGPIEAVQAGRTNGELV